MPLIFTLRCRIALALLWPALTVSAQTEPKIFASADGVFQFKVSPVLVDCTKLAPTEPESSGVPQVFVGHPAPMSVPKSCESQSDICSDGGNEGRLLACFAYPKDRFRDKPTFTAAAFFVAYIEQVTTEKACLQGSRNWDPAEMEKARVIKINGVAFKVFEITNNNWAGGSQWGPVYRTFHDNKCYELGLQTAMEHGGYDGKTIGKFTKQDTEEVQGRLKQALNSFMFLK
jgi:hypothetical protein